MATLELFGTASCPHTQEMREWLEFGRREFVEYDVEVDADARRRMRELAGGQRNVPVLVEDGQGHSGWLARTRLRCECGVRMASACSIRVRGVVQGVGFRPFVYRLAMRQYVGRLGTATARKASRFILEGAEPGLQTFVEDLQNTASARGQHSANRSSHCRTSGLNQFHDSREPAPRTAHGSHLPRPPCLRRLPAELFNPSDRRFHYPYINCTNCGPRYSVILALPYDRQNTTMKSWPLDEYCNARIRRSSNRRFHAQPVACPECGPATILIRRNHRRGVRSEHSPRRELLNAGTILAVKGLGGYHLACDARNETAVQPCARANSAKKIPSR